MTTTMQAIEADAEDAARRVAHLSGEDIGLAGSFLNITRMFDGYVRDAYFE
ncbi:MAG: hypothetical protein WCB48_17000 [Casimicrobiaceae bacterium]